MIVFFKKLVLRRKFCLLSFCVLVFFVGCGGKEKSKMANLTVKVIFVDIPQRTTWSSKSDEVILWGKLVGSPKSKGKIPKTRFRLRREVDLADVRGLGITSVQDTLKPGNWEISVKYKRNDILLDMNKGLGKCQLNLEVGKPEKIYFSYDSAKGFVLLPEKDARAKESDFFLHGQKRIKEMKAPPAPEPDYGKY